jgi:putative hydrolase of the HAD superfamily
MRYKAIIFDLFGTLVENLLAHQYRKILVEITTILSIEQNDFINFWLEYSDERMTGKISNMDCLSIVCQRMGLEISEELCTECMKVFTNRVMTRLEPSASTIIALSNLRTRGYGIGLISNCSDEVSLLWDNSPLATVIRDPVFSSSVGVKKPDQEIFLLTAEKMHVKPWECIFVDDSVDYLLGAEATGMNGLLIQDRTLNSSSNDPDSWDGYTISSIREMEILLGDLERR